MVYHGKEKENHAGSIVQYPILKKGEYDFDIETNPIIRWVKETLTEPVDGQFFTFIEQGAESLVGGIASGPDFSGEENTVSGMERTDSF